MKRRLDTMFTLGLGNIIYTIEFLKDPYKCYERLGSSEELKDRVHKAMELKYGE